MKLLSPPFRFRTYDRPPLRLRLRLHFRLTRPPGDPWEPGGAEAEADYVGVCFRAPFLTIFGLHFGFHFRPFVVIVRIFFRVRF